MKNQVKTYCYLLFYFLIFSNKSLAGGEVSGGGTLLICNSRNGYNVSLFDLENYKEAQLKLSKFILHEVKDSSLKIATIDIEKMIGYNYLINLQNPIINHILKYTLTEANWFSTNVDLAAIYDVSNPNKIKKGCRLFQLAIHYNRDIVFQKDLLKMLEQNPIQQAAAILHEALRIYSHTRFYDAILYPSYHSPELHGFTSKAIEEMVSQLIQSQPLSPVLDTAFKLAMNHPFYSEEEVLRLSGINTPLDQTMIAYDSINFMNNWLDNQGAHLQDKAKINNLKDLIMSYSKIKQWTYRSTRTYFDLKNKLRATLSYYEKIKKDEMLKSMAEVFEDLNLGYGCHAQMNTIVKIDKLICMIDKLDTDEYWNFKIALVSILFAPIPRSKEYLSRADIILTYENENYFEIELPKQSNIMNRKSSFFVKVINAETGFASLIINSGRDKINPNKEQKQFIDDITKALKFIKVKFIEVIF